MRFIKEFRENGRILKGGNILFIVLVLKEDIPQQIRDFHLISLIGCIYKILSKLLANRLSFVLGKIILENQTDFIKGRQILDDILIENELVNEAEKKKEENNVNYG